LRAEQKFTQRKSQVRVLFLGGDMCLEGVSFIYKRDYLLV